MVNGTIGYQIKGNSINGVLYIKDKKIYSIRYADKYLYRNGKYEDKLSNYFLTSSEEVEIKAQSEIAIKKILKSSSTAKFSDWRYSKENGYIIAQGCVDSQNSFGTISRNTFQVKTKSGIIKSIIIDEKEYIK